MKIEREEPIVVFPNVSEEEYQSWTNEDSNWEYLGGDLVMEPAPTIPHEDLSGFLNALVRIFLEERGGGVALGSRAAMRLDEKWSPQPDLVVVREERRHLISQRAMEGPADLVIEIASGSCPGIDLRRKVPRYREARIPEIWILNPIEKSVRVETLGVPGSPGFPGSPGSSGLPGSPGSDVYTTTILTAGRLASAVIPGFWLEVSWLWQEPLPPVSACLRQILA